MAVVCSFVSGGAVSRILLTCSSPPVRPNASFKSETRTRVLMTGRPSRPLTFSVCAARTLCLMLRQMVLVLQRWRSAAAATSIHSSLGYRVSSRSIEHPESTGSLGRSRALRYARDLVEGDGCGRRCGARQRRSRITRRGRDRGATFNGRRGLEDFS